MPDSRVRVILAAGGVSEVSVPGTLRVFTPVQRLTRAAAMMLVAIILAGSLLPIPIIHLIGPPALLITGMVLAVRQLRAGVRLAPTHIACPKCGYRNRVGGGQGWHNADHPMERHCDSCRRILEMRIEIDRQSPAG
jgi:hypothetical protein